MHKKKTDEKFKLNSLHSWNRLKIIWNDERKTK